MSLLRTKDLKAVLEAVLRLQESESAAELPKAMCAAVESLIPGEIVGYSEFDLSHLAGRSLADHDLDGLVGLLEVRPIVLTNDPHTEREINRLVPCMVRHADQHPLFGVALDEPDPPVAKISDFLSLPQFRNLALYGQFFRPLKMTRQIAVCPTKCNGVVTGLTVNRRGRDFSERDRQLLALLSPHLRAAFQAAALRASLNSELGALRQRTAGLPSACLCLSKDSCRILFETDVARRFLEKCFPGAEGRGLPDPIGRWLRESVRKAGSLDGLGTVNSTLTLMTSAGELTVILVPAADAIYLWLKYEQSKRSVSLLKKLGLTAREAEVLNQMRDGLTNGQIGNHLKISAGTVRTHVERILSKLAVDTRTAAVRRAEEFLHQLTWD